MAWAERASRGAASFPILRPSRRPFRSLRSRLADWRIWKSEGDFSSKIHRAKRVNRLTSCQHPHSVPKKNQTVYFLREAEFQSGSRIERVGFIFLGIFHAPNFGLIPSPAGR